MLDITSEVVSDGEFFKTKDEIAPGKNVRFKATWKNNKEWYFEGRIGDDRRSIHITAIGSL